MSAVTLWALGAALAVSSGQSRGELAEVSVGGIILRVPKDWGLAIEGGTHTWQSPSGDHLMKLDVGTVQTKGMKPKVCVDKILAAMGNPKGWKRFDVAKKPAARRVDVDAAEEGSAEVETTTVIGCDGKTTWSVVYSVEKSKRDTSWLQRVVKTVRYGGGSTK